MWIYTFYGNQLQQTKRIFTSRLGVKLYVAIDSILIKIIQRVLGIKNLLDQILRKWQEVIMTFLMGMTYDICVVWLIFIIQRTVDSLIETKNRKHTNEWRFYIWSPIISISPFDYTKIMLRSFIADWSLWLWICVSTCKPEQLNMCVYL